MQNCKCKFLLDKSCDLKAAQYNKVCQQMIEKENFWLREC